MLFTSKSAFQEFRSVKEVQIIAEKLTSPSDISSVPHKNHQTSKISFLVTFGVNDVWVFV